MGLKWPSSVMNTALVYSSQGFSFNYITFIVSIMIIVKTVHDWKIVKKYGEKNYSIVLPLEKAKVKIRSVLCVSASIIS